MSETPDKIFAKNIFQYYGMVPPTIIIMEPHENMASKPPKEVQQANLILQKRGDGYLIIKRIKQLGFKDYNANLVSEEEAHDIISEMQIFINSYEESLMPQLRDRLRLDIGKKLAEIDYLKQMLITPLKMPRQIIIEEDGSSWCAMDNNVLGGKEKTLCYGPTPEDALSAYVQKTAEDFI